MTAEELIGYRTTFHGMFEQPREDASEINSVEIPLIQRDYAQGRTDARANAVRANFLDALHGGLSGSSRVGLDFIYGEVNDGTFEPLDGQQRLTTLFLLHWYLAFRCAQLSAAAAWTRFTYATRPSARLFCERIVRNPPPHDLSEPLSDWITDQSWYLHLWRFDPTISAMLVTLDAINERFKGEDHEVLWRRLVDDEEPVIWFQLLPIEEMGAAEDLYIKMNSRGKPLTEFEAFKAHLGQLVAQTGAADDFGHKIDGAWTDLFWPYRGDNDVVDDEFMRYFDFLIEVCEWREERVRGDEAELTPEQRVSRLLTKANPRHLEHLEFITQAFDVWVTDPIPEVFDSLFRTTMTGDGLRLFGAPSTNLLQTCCERYGAMRGRTRLFSLTDTLLLLAVLVHKINNTEDAPARLRSLRNANEASQFELRVQNMPKLVKEVDAFMRTGDLGELATFNQNQVADEALKRELVRIHPELDSAVKLLEDHTILRGTLAAFDLDSTLASRAPLFEAAFDSTLWPILTGALLALGEYQRDYPNSDMHQFGSPSTEGVWRSLLVDRGDRKSLERIRTVVGNLLDDLSAGSDTADVALRSIAQGFIDDRASRCVHDWRYYLVRYSWMREGNSGIYYGADGRLGYEMTMLRKTVQRSWYRDAYLYAIWCEAGRPEEVDDPWFYGYSTAPRWMKLLRSGTGLRSVSEGLVLQAPVSTNDEANFETVRDVAGAVQAGDGWLLQVPQSEVEGELVDSVDRVQMGAQLLKNLVEGGL